VGKLMETTRILSRGTAALCGSSGQCPAAFGMKQGMWQVNHLPCLMNQIADSISATPSDK